MKIIEQYLHVIGERLPFRGRKDILNELRSVILDNIEERYGPAPDKSDVKEFLKSFGNPDEVAGRYIGEKPVISEKLSGLYFLLLKVVLGALFIAFLVVSVISVINGPRDVKTLLQLAGMFLGNLFNAWFLATGVITVMFIAVSHFASDKLKPFKEEWNPDVLEAVLIEEKEVPRILYPVGITLFTLFVVLLNIFPSVVTHIENLFFGTGLGEGFSHRIHVPVFAMFIRILTVLWAGEIAVIISQLKGKISAGKADAIKHLITAGTLLVYAFMIFGTSLYREYSGIIGFKLIFILVAVVEAADLVSSLFQYGKKAVQRGSV
ncbi:MAG: hypothetical protein GX556_06545 [Fibrobacter sp.]|nr:hypothetical protein [Fibrobacter sp.]